MILGSTYPKLVHIWPPEAGQVPKIGENGVLGGFWGFWVVLGGFQARDHVTRASYDPPDPFMQKKTLLPRGMLGCGGVAQLIVWVRGCGPAYRLGAGSLGVILRPFPESDFKNESTF